MYLNETNRSPPNQLNVLKSPESGLLNTDPNVTSHAWISESIRFYGIVMIFSCFSFHFKEYIIKQDMNWDSCFAFPSLTWVLSFLVIICTLMVWSCRVTGKGKPRNVLDITCNNTAPATFRIILCLDPIHTIYIFLSAQMKNMYFVTPLSLWSFYKEIRKATNANNILCTCILQQNLYTRLIDVFFYWLYNKFLLFLSNICL